jgi:hypothetical protein
VSRRFPFKIHTVQYSIYDVTYRERCVLMVNACGSGSHPLWNLASVLYYDRHLSEDDVKANFVASQCLELEKNCPKKNEWTNPNGDAGVGR